MKLIDRDTNKDAIIAYLKDPDGKIENLSEKQQQLLRFYLDGYNLIRNYNSMPDAVNVLVKMARHAGEPISESTARRYIIEGRNIFGDVNKVSKQAALDYALGVIQDGINMARDQNNPQVMIFGGEKYYALSSKEDPEAFDPELIEQHIYEIMMDKKAQKVVDNIAARGVIDLDALMGNVMNSMAADAEEVKGDPEN
jgi:hypothetical protein